MGGEKVWFANAYPDWDDESKRKWEETTMEIVRRKAEAIVNDPNQSPDVKRRAREFLGKKENKENKR
jgi:hypothetical protein